MLGTHSAEIDVSDEQELIARAVNRDEEAVRIIVRRYNRRLYRLARSVLRDDSEAEDALQQAYVHAFTHLAAFRGEARLSTWLSRIVLNEALGRLRRCRPTVELAAMERDAEMNGHIIPFPGAGTPPDPERQLAQSEIQGLLEKAIDQLPDGFRTVLVARVIEEMSVEETAALLGLRSETVKTRLHRARGLVRDAIEKQLGPALTSAFPFDGWRCERMVDAVVGKLSQLRV